MSSLDFLLKSAAKFDKWWNKKFKLDFYIFYQDTDTKKKEGVE